MNFSLYHGDCISLMALMPENSVDSIVTDPPYELGFMGKKWDSSGIAYSVDLWRAALRVLRPGGHLLAFGATRTYHRMACAIEDAEFEIRDSLHWFYGSGFPKYKNVSKAIDDAAGAERKVVGKGRTGGGRTAMNDAPGHGRARDYLEGDYEITAPATDAAKQWEGWATALKPAHEPIILARKPMIGILAANVLAHGTGALNIDACRIGTSDDLSNGVKRTEDLAPVGFEGGFRSVPTATHASGRWPANILLDEAAALELDEQSLAGGMHPAGGARDGSSAEVSDSYNASAYHLGPHKPFRVGDAGGASRFFYVAKPSRKERDFGCDHLPARTGGEATDRKDGSAGVDNPRAGAGRTGGAKNYHPTVKPVGLMRYLVRLITPPGGVVLDPFVGSGSTGAAALLESFRFIGIDQEEAYLEIAHARIDAFGRLGINRGREPESAGGERSGALGFTRLAC